MDKLLGPKEEPREYIWARDAYEWDPHRAAVEAKTGRRARKGSRRANRKTLCQVPDCGKDLTGEKVYSRRYRICDVHLKMDAVHVDGKLQRFCQQCSRFHELDDFDGSQRSCRQMLILRNLRRRKRHQAPDEDSGSQDNSSSRATDHTVRERQHPQQHSKRQGVSSPPSQDTSDECAAVSRAVATGTGHRSGRKRRTGPWSYLLDSPQVSQLSSDSLPQGVKDLQASPSLDCSSGLVAQMASARLEQQHSGQAGQSQEHCRPQHPAADSNTSKERRRSSAAIAAMDALQGPAPLCDPLSPAAVQQQVVQEALQEQELSEADLLQLRDALGTSSSSMPGLPGSGSMLPAWQQPARKAPQPCQQHLLDSIFGGASDSLGQVHDAGDDILADLDGLLGQELQQQQQQQQYQQQAMRGSGSGGLMAPLFIAPACSLPQPHGIDAELYNDLVAQELLAGKRGPAELHSSSSCQHSQLRALPAMQPQPAQGSMQQPSTSGCATGLPGLQADRCSMGPSCSAAAQHQPSISSLYVPRSSMAMGDALGSDHLGRRAPAAAGTSAACFPGLVPAAGPPLEDFTMPAMDLVDSLMADDSLLGYQPEGELTRLCLKLQNCRPEQLPQDALKRVINLMIGQEGMLVQAFLRSGCVHLTLEAVRKDGSSTAISWGQVARALGPQVTQGRRILLQQGTKACVLGDGQQLADWDAAEADGPCSIAASVARAEPCCVVAGDQGVVLQLAGTNLAAAGTTLHARFQGEYLEAAVLPVADAGEEAAGGMQHVAVHLPALQGPGLLLLEAEHDRLVSQPVPVLVLPSSEMRAEVLQLVQAAGEAKTQEVHRVLLDLGRLLDFQVVALQHRDAVAQARRRSQVVDSATSDMSMHLSADALGSEDEYEDDVEEEAEGMAEEQGEQEVQRAAAVGAAQQQVAGAPGQGSSAAAAAAMAAGEGHAAAAAAAADTCCMTDDSAYLVDGSGAGPHPWLSPSWADHVQATAQRLLQVVCRRGLAHTTSWLLELLHAQSCDAAELVKGTTSRGLTLLHLAAMAGSGATTQVLLAWSQQQHQQHVLGLTALGPGGLTPLHLAAAAAGSYGALGAAAQDLCQDLLLTRQEVPALWMGCAADDGTTPAMVAQRKGVPMVNGVAAALLRRAMPQVVASALQPEPVPAGLQEEEAGQEQQVQAEVNKQHSDAAAPLQEQKKPVGQAEGKPSSSQAAMQAAAAAPSSAGTGRHRAHMPAALRWAATWAPMLSLMLLLAKMTWGAAATLARGDSLALVLLEQAPLLLVCSAFTAAASSYTLLGQHSGGWCSWAALQLQRLQLVPALAPAPYGDVDGPLLTPAAVERDFLLLLTTGLVTRFTALWQNHLSIWQALPLASLIWSGKGLYAWHLGTLCLLASFVCMGFRRMYARMGQGPRCLLQLALLLSCKTAMRQQAPALLMLPMLLESAVLTLLLVTSHMPQQSALQLVATDVSSTCASLVVQGSRLLLPLLLAKLLLLAVVNQVVAALAPRLQVHAKRN